MSIKNISRIDNKKTNSWRVHIFRKGERESKLFTDNKYGGKEESLKEAYTYRNAIYKRLITEKAQKEKIEAKEKGRTRKAKEKKYKIKRKKIAKQLAFFNRVDQSKKVRSPQQVPINERSLATVELFDYGKGNQRFIVRWNSGDDIYIKYYECGRLGFYKAKNLAYRTAKLHNDKLEK